MFKRTLLIGAASTRRCRRLLALSCYELFCWRSYALHPQRSLRTRYAMSQVFVNTITASLAPVTQPTAKGVTRRDLDLRPSKRLSLLKIFRTKIVELSSWVRARKRASHPTHTGSVEPRTSMNWKSSSSAVTVAPNSARSTRISRTRHVG